MPPSKKRTTRSTRTSSKRRSAKPASKRRAPGKKPASKRRATRARNKQASRRRGRAAPRPSWRRWLLVELLTWCTGLALGLAIAGAFLWHRAATDVDGYLADPPRTHPSIVYSAPIQVQVGQAATVVELAGELLAAGYDKVEDLSGPGQFAVGADRLEVWTEAMEHPLPVPGGRVAVDFEDRRVAGVDPGGRAVFRPTVLATIGDLEGRRTEVELDRLGSWVEPAVLAMEDARFREHHGIDPLGVVRALVHNLGPGTDLHGGSTLTQQLAKNLFLSPERTLQRKVREAFFAAALEHRLSKDELLELYLGEVYLGQVGGVPIHGVEQAARAWFGVGAARLDLGQSATIAGVISAPNRYSPVRHPQRARERRDLVLERMVATGALDATEAARASADPLEVDGVLPGAVRRAPWAVDAAVDATEDALGQGSLSSYGYRVHTTIQPLLQRAAERAVSEGMSELDTGYPEAVGAQVALVAVQVADGSVVALVGGRDYRASPFDRATNAWRQAGSTVKPLTLLAAFDRDPDLSPISRIVDEPISRRVDGSPWTPSNYDGRYLGEISLRSAIEGSRNIPAVKLAEQVGPEPLQRLYRDTGLSRATLLPSAALGAFPTTPWEMAGAYTVFPGGGRVAVPRLVEAVADAEGRAVLSWSPEHRDVASAGAAALATRILQGVITDGTGARATRYGVRGPVGGKTGTTDDYRDAWFVGFTPELAIAVWVGRDRGADLGLSGSRAALPTWSRFAVASGTLVGELPVPDGMVERPVCVDSHRLARDACPITYRELFREGAVPKERCDVHGSPLVETGRILRDLFRRKDRRQRQ